MIPAYLTPAEIAKANDMTTENCRAKLARAGILERDGNRRWHVAESRLRERLPEMYERVFSAAMFGEGQTGSDKARAG